MLMDTITNQIILESKHNRAFLCDITYSEQIQNKPVILFVHGFKSFKDWGIFPLIANDFALNGFVFIRFNLSHNGTTIQNPLDITDLDAFGKNNFSIELDDIQAVVEHVCKNINPKEIYILGHSRGGGLALLHAAENDLISKVATWAAIHNFSERWEKNVVKDWKNKGVMYVLNSRTLQQLPLYYQIVEDYYKNEHRLSIPKNVRKIKVPILVCHGSNDETLPVKMAHEIASWNTNAELFVIEGTGHTFDCKHPMHKNEDYPDKFNQLLTKTIQFFKQ